MDMQRNGFAEHVRDADAEASSSGRKPAAPFAPAEVDPELAARWEAFADLPVGTLGHAVWDMYDGRGFDLPGTAGGAPAYLAQHDFVHILADYGTALRGELEVFAFIGRADPDPKGFAWIATMVGLFETGYVHEQGFFQIDVRERKLQNTGMGTRLADAVRRGKAVAEHFGTDLFVVDFHALAQRPVDEVRALLHLPPKSPEAIAAGSVGLFDPAGMSERQREAFAQRTAR
jgi:hypothetical protein